MAPSRDSARTFASFDRVKHIVLGGWWYNKSEQKYVSASSKVVNLLKHQKEYAQLLGMAQDSKRCPGKHFYLSHILLSLKKKLICLYCRICCSNH